MTRLLIGLIFAVGGCSPPPRAISYFEGHPQEAAEVLHDCAAGTHRGRECQNAQGAKARLDAQARMNLFRKGFE
jgi:hypothetical protein